MTTHMLHGDDPKWQATCSGELCRICALTAAMAAFADESSFTQAWFIAIARQEAGLKVTWNQLVIEDPC